MEGYKKSEIYCYGCMKCQDKKTCFAPTKDKRGCDRFCHECRIVKNKGNFSELEMSDIASMAVVKFYRLNPETGAMWWR